VNPVSVIVNIAIPVVILLTLSAPDRLGALPALLLAIGIPAVWGMIELKRAHRVDISATLGLISVLLTGVIGVLGLNAQLLAVKEAAIPIGFAIVLLASNATRFPVVTLLADMVQRRDRVRTALDRPAQQAAYHRHLQRSGAVWAGIMTLSGVLKFILASVVVNSAAGTEAFNHELARYELVQLPTTFTLSGVLILSLIWYIASGTAKITGLETAEVLRGGQKVERIAKRFAPIARVFPATAQG
jgi:intracellular septation protein A